MHISASPTTDRPPQFPRLLDQNRRSRARKE
jgi:hypothetical protein